MSNEQPHGRRAGHGTIAPIDAAGQSNRLSLIVTVTFERMTRLAKPSTILLLLALCAACDRRPAGNDPGSVTANDGGSHAENILAEEDVAALRSRTIEALRRDLPDVESAAFTNLRSGLDGAICGTFTTAATGSRAFLVQQNGTASISPSPRIAYDDPFDSFAGLYARLCASLEELQAARNALVESSNLMASPAAPAARPEIMPIPDDPMVPETDFPLPDPAPADPRWSRPGPAPGTAPADPDARRFTDEVARPAPAPRPGT